jgi:broad specificity phosphatase PhoE
MAETVILVMRHAEKPDDPLDPDLSPAGRARAQRLASCIPSTFGKPGFLFASAVSKHSHRPIETLEPLSLQCGVKIDSSYADQDYGALAQELRTNNAYHGCLVVVCWHHGNIHA